MKKRVVLMAMAVMVCGLAYSSVAMARGEYLYIGERNHETVYGKIVNEKGDPIVARVELWYADIDLEGISEEYGIEIPESSRYLRQLFHQDVSDEKGWYYVTGVPGEYILRITRGPEWEIVEIPITIREMTRANGSTYRELDGQRHDITLSRLYNLEKYGWFAGDTHHHTFLSDGRDSPRKVKMSAVASGLSWGTLMDHNTLAGNEPFMDHAGEDFLAIPGVEITTANTPEAAAIHKGWGHQNALGVEWLPGAKDPENPILWDRYIYETWEDVQQGIEDTHAQGGLFMLNHVMSADNWYGGSTSTWGQIRDYDAIEVWNAYHGNTPFSPWTGRFTDDNQVWNEHTVSMQVWFEFLNAGNKIAGWASSDSHDTTGLNQGGAAPIDHRGITGFASTYVKVDELNWTNVRDGLKEGNVFMTAGSFGPLLFVRCEGKMPGEEIYMPRRKNRVNCAITVLSNRPLVDYPNGIRVIMNGQVVKELPTKGGRMHMTQFVSIPTWGFKDSWLIVDAFGEWPSYAVTNPIYINLDGDDHWGAEEWTYPEGAEEWMNPWPIAPEITVPDGPSKPWFADEISEAYHAYGNPINPEDWWDENGLPII